MNKKKKIQKIDKVLVDLLGIPHKSKTPPDPVDLLIATILSQNTNDNNSYKAYENLKKRFPDWEMIVHARITSIEKEIKVAGLYKQKAKAIKEFVKDLKAKQKKISLNHLLEKDDQSILEELVNYNGVGFKTASCLLLFALERNVCPVDTHVHRIVNRLGIVSEKTPDKTYFALNEDFPPKIAHRFHTNLIRFGRAICKPKNPLCYKCPLVDDCEFEEKNFEIKSNIKQRDFMLLDNVRKE